MSALSLHNLFLLIVLLQSSKTERRIKDGKEVRDNKRYLVYLLKAANSRISDPDWTCGGAIVSPSFVVSSAACVEDAKHLYVIAGYRKFVPVSELNNDDCLRRKKKKVIFTCVPLKYSFDYHTTEKWSSIDIAVLQVETPFDFKDKSYEEYCSYTPGMIKVNHDAWYQDPGTYVIAMGWGHKSIWRSVVDKKGYNQETLHYVSTKVLKKEECIKYFNKSPQMVEIINKFMLCTLHKGNLDDGGEIIYAEEHVHNDGCTEELLRAGKCKRNPEYDDGEIIEMDPAYYADYSRKRNFQGPRIQNILKKIKRGVVQNTQNNSMRHRRKLTVPTDLSIDYDIDSQEFNLPSKTTQKDYLMAPKLNYVQYSKQTTKLNNFFDFYIDSQETIWKTSSTVLANPFKINNVHKSRIGLKSNTIKSKSIFRSDLSIDYDIDSQEKKAVKFNIDSDSSNQRDGFSKTNGQNREIIKHRTKSPIKSPFIDEESLDEDLKNKKTTTFHQKPVTTTQRDLYLDDDIDSIESILSNPNLRPKTYATNYLQNIITKRTALFGLQMSKVTELNSLLTSKRAFKIGSRKGTSNIQESWASSISPENNAHAIIQNIVNKNTITQTATKIDYDYEFEERKNENRENPQNNINNFLAKEYLRQATNVTNATTAVTNATTTVVTVTEKSGEDEPGICQNDHGSPLVAWMGSHEVLIGVATLFKVNEDNECRGPYLFTSTYCNSAFIYCILSWEDNPNEMTRRCKDAEDEGIKLVQRHISWDGHEDGPAANERFEDKNKSQPHLI